MITISSALRISRWLPAGLALAACASSPAPATSPTAPQTAAPMAQPAMAQPAMAEAPMAHPPAMAAEPKPAESPAPPKLSLEVTPAERLGTAPAGLGLDVNAKAPDATLTDLSGKPQRLAALYATGPTFLVFYRGGWCPFCNLQLHQLALAKAEFEQRGIHLVAISVDQPGEEAKTQAKHGVPFAMLSDSTLIAHKAFNVVHVQTEVEATNMKKFGVDVEQYSGQKHHSFAVPAIFLIDRAGKIRWQHIDNDFKTRPSPAQMLEVADRVLVAKK
jgi:peroxiredoxin